MGGGKSPIGGGGGGGGAKATKAVMEMVGKDNLVEFDNGNHPNKFAPDDPRWGTEAGVYTVYRTGDLSRDIIFTANTYEGSAVYADAFPKEAHMSIAPDRSGVNTYTVKIKNPYVSKDLGSTYEALFGKKVRLDPTSSEMKKGVTTGDLWVKADERICKKLKSLGYDAWTMTNPAPPAIREMNILGKAKDSMTKTARKVPDRVKKEWAKEASEGGFFAHAYKNGKPTGLTISEWFKSDDYKKGKAAGKWA